MRNAIFSSASTSSLLIAATLFVSCRPASNTTQQQNKSGAGVENTKDAEGKDPDDDNNVDDNKVRAPIPGTDTTQAPSDTYTLPTVPDPSGTGAKIPAFCATIKEAGAWKSAHAYYGADGKLTYPLDSEKNRIADFSFAGYHYGSDEPPVYPVISTIGPIAGDNTKHIQDALNELAKKAPDAKGVRGALLLKPGRYTVLGTIVVGQSGVVLRGSGSGSDESKDTILIGDKDVPHQRTIIVLGNGKDKNWKATGAEVEITDAFVGVGSKEFSVKDASSFKKGGLIQIKHPSTQAWIDALKGGGPIAEPHWTPGSTDIIYHRRILAIEGKLIRLDAPVFNHLDRKLSVSTVSNLSDSGVVSESGVENLRVDIVTKGGEDENHAWDAVGVWGAQDSWVKNITALHFGQSGVYTRDAMRITVDGTTAIEPVGIRTGERFYNYNTEAFSQLILFKNCAAKDGRHNFISNGVQTTSGVVWYRCTSDGPSASEGHRRWSQGLLFDSITEKAGGSINIFNRGDAGTSHGWGSAHSVIWNYSGSSVVQKPPTAQNYFISPVGKKTVRAGETEGVVEIKAGKLGPASLYEAQLCERLQK